MHFLSSHLTPNRSFRQRSELPASTIHFRKERALVERLLPTEIEYAGHSCSELIAVAQKFLSGTASVLNRPSQRLAYTLGS